MYIIEVCSGLHKKIIISEVTKPDFKRLTSKRYSFSWKSLKEMPLIYKLQIKEEKEILGVIALIDYPAEKRIEIKLLANSIENKGRNKQYDRIAGCLIAFASQLAVDKYRKEACISLIPKTELIHHYMTKYYMTYGGRQLYMESEILLKLIKEYAS